MAKIDVLKALKGSKLTEFQKAVLRETYRIPKGSTATYKEIAERIGRPSAYRAVGTALRMNPLAPAIPCHRVIKSDGSTGNYSGKGGKAKKRRMLKEEHAI